MEPLDFFGLSCHRGMGLAGGGAFVLLELPLKCSVRSISTRMQLCSLSPHKGIH